MLEPIAIRRLPVVALAASGLVLTACQGEPEKTPAPATEPAAAPAAPATPSPPPVLSRTDLIQAAEAAASAYAAGSGPNRASGPAGTGRAGRFGRSEPRIIGGFSFVRKHLGPGCGVQCPAVAEDSGLARTQPATIAKIAK